MALVTVDGYYTFPDMLMASQSPDISGTATFAEMANIDAVLAGSGIYVHDMATVTTAVFVHIRPVLGNIDVYLNGGSQPLPLEIGGDIITRKSAIDAISIGYAGDTQVAIRALGA